MDTFVSVIPESSVEGGFYRAILAIHQNQFTHAEKLITRTRELVDTELTALMRESYKRAYNVVVRVQQLGELEEVIKYKQCEDEPERQAMIKKIWQDRLLGTQRDVDTWSRLLAIHSLVLTPIEHKNMWLKFASICRKSNRTELAGKTLIGMLGSDPKQKMIEGNGHRGACLCCVHTSLSIVWLCVFVFLALTFRFAFFSLLFVLQFFTTTSLCASRPFLPRTRRLPSPT